MTVCLAAICTWPGGGQMIVGASDRMLSAPDIKFEPPQMKIFQFTEDVIALVAGDPYDQITICNETTRVLEAKRIQGRAVGSVEEIAKIYSEAFSKLRREKAESRFLKPMGIDAIELATRQSEFDPAFVSKVTKDMQCLALDAETIIAGKDSRGCHLFIVDDPGVPRCADAIGFASIGSGKNHADSQFMMARHTKNTSFHTALLQTYAAKKRAEVSPSVGTDTDLFYIGIKDGFQIIHEDLYAAVDRTFQSLEAVSHEARVRADEQVRQFLIKHLSGVTEAQKPSDAVKPQVTSAKPKKPKKSAA